MGLGYSQFEANREHCPRNPSAHFPPSSAQARLSIQGPRHRVIKAVKHGCLYNPTSGLCCSRGALLSRRVVFWESAFDVKKKKAQGASGFARRICVGSMCPCGSKP